MSPGYCFLFSAGRFLQVWFSSILYVEVLPHQVRVITDYGPVSVHYTLQQLQNILPKAGFCRISSGCLVSIARIVGFDDGAVRLGKKRIVLEKKYKRRFTNHFLVLQCIAEEDNASRFYVDKSGALKI